MGFGVAAFATKWLARPTLDKQHNGGRGGIRTHGTLAGTPVFKTGALNHSATLPKLECQSLSVRHLRRQCEPSLEPAHPINGDRSLRRKGVGWPLPAHANLRARSGASRTVSLFLFRWPRGHPTQTMLRRPGLAKPVGVGVPGAPVNAGQAAEIGRQRAPGLPIVLHDDLLGLRDLSLQLGNQLSGLLNGLRIGDLADRELGGADAPEGLAVLSDLRPMPSDLAVTIRSHLIPLTRAKRDTIHFRFATIWRFHVAPLRRPDAWAPGRERRLESQPICAVRRVQWRCGPIRTVSTALLKTSRQLRQTRKPASLSPEV